MRTTVHFATNRAVTNGGNAIIDYGDTIVSPSDPTKITYATAFVEGVDIASNSSGAIVDIEDITQGDFSQSARDDLSAPGRNILVFVHGFDNTFEDAITRAAFNREWIAASGATGADTSIVAFSWPSLGRLVDFPFLPSDYQHDQTMAGQSGVHIMNFFARLKPLLDGARASGQRAHLLCHSMGNWALQAAVESWFTHGQGDATLFDQAILAAADERYDSFDFPSPGRLSGLDALAHQISVYYSSADMVLSLSSVVNLGVRRLGQQGPHDRTDPAKFPPARFRLVDCSAFRDFDFNFMTSHQYYRCSPSARANIAAVL